MMHRAEKTSDPDRWAKLRDEELVALWRENTASGGGPAAAEMLGRYRMRVYRWCRSYVGDHETALDLAQDALLKVYQDFASLREGTRFGTWLFVIVRNKCLDELKRRRVRGADAIDPDTLPASSRDPEEVWLERIEFEHFAKILGTVLDPLEKEAISLRCFEKMPVDSITKVLGIDTSSGARGVLQSARRKLRAAVGEPGDPTGRKA